MATEIYLGNPPQHVIDWIKAHSKPAANPKTKITFTDGSKGEYLIEGVMDYQALIAAGLMPEGSGTSAPPIWIKSPLEVNIGSAVTSIGDYAFYDCSGLTSVTIPSSVTSIGPGAFSGCSGLTSVIIPNSVTSIESGTFSACSGLTSVTIPDSVTSIGNGAFSGCSGLTSVIIPNSVKNIEYYAFDGCSGLTSIVVEGGTTA